MTRRHSTDSKGRKLREEIIQEVWEKGKRVRGKDSNLYRRDVAGNVIYKPSYGKDSDMGWEVDHERPVSKGGKDNLGNLQPLQTDENRDKGNEYPWKP